MKFLATLFVVACCSHLALAQPVKIDAASQIPLWTSRSATQPASAEVDDGTGRYRNVSNPMLFVWPAAADKVNGTAIIVCPGGSYDHITMELEGQRIAKFFNPMGVAVFGLKYHTTPPSKDVAADALADGQRAMRLVRSHAKEWKIDPNKVGMLGYSAGSNLVLNAASHFDRGKADAADEIDHQSCRPDFVVLLSTWPNKQTLDKFPLSAESPKAFLAHAKDDRTAPVQFALDIKQKLDELKVPAELQLFDTGGHGAFHLGENTPAADWSKRVVEWMTKNDLLSASK